MLAGQPYLLLIGFCVQQFGGIKLVLFIWVQTRLDTLGERWIKNSCLLALECHVQTRFRISVFIHFMVKTKVGCFVILMFLSVPISQNLDPVREH